MYRRGSQFTIRYLIYMRYHISKIWADNQTYWNPLYFKIKCILNVLIQILMIALSVIPRTSDDAFLKHLPATP
jgi:hypothetical protein